MELRNAMEAIVQRAVVEACEERESGASECATAQCRVDVQAYVLNRIPPRYVSSGRGLTHLIAEIERDQQLQVDVMRLVQEGFARVAAVQRSYYGVSGGQQIIAGTPLFNFPTMYGRVLNGATFEPLADVSVELSIDGAPARMFDERWQNPFKTVGLTNGRFTFWPAPIAAAKADEARTFECAVSVSRAGFAPAHHSFALALVSRTAIQETISLENDQQVADIYLFAGR